MVLFLPKHWSDPTAAKCLKFWPGPSKPMLFLDVGMMKCSPYTLFMLTNLGSPYFHRIPLIAQRQTPFVTTPIAKSVNSFKWSNCLTVHLPSPQYYCMLIPFSYSPGSLFMLTPWADRPMPMYLRTTREEKKLNCGRFYTVYNMESPWNISLIAQSINFWGFSQVNFEKFSSKALDGTSKSSSQR